MFRYFAYGSALSRRHIGEWAAEHGVDARLFARGAPAVLRGYSLVFDVESRFWGGRIADLADRGRPNLHLGPIGFGIGPVKCGTCCPACGRCH